MNETRKSADATELLLHPLVLGALALWLVNDHVLKAAYSSWLTGKLSDVASLIVAPLLVFTTAQLLLPARAVQSAHARRWMLFAALVCVGGVMIAIKLFLPAAWAYRAGLGVMQWPARALASLARGEALPHVRRVQLAMDPTDLWTLPSLALPAWLGWRTEKRSHVYDDGVARGA